MKYRYLNPEKYAHGDKTITSAENKIPPNILN
jgi:hypothetical protein